ncbi:MAG: Txe/YoeB family addiction module toxin [Bacteroidetes bacterium]|nr:Txe/YoeB family addiction module toxin [Bacteroidota bacterium]
MKKVVFEAEAFDDYNNWAIFDIKTLKKIMELLKDIKRDPFKGLGKPEPLKHELAGYWSRRITDEHRLVYKISDNDIIIISCKGHY